MFSKQIVYSHCYKIRILLISTYNSMSIFMISKILILNSSSWDYFDFLCGFQRFLFYFRIHLNEKKKRYFCLGNVSDQWAAVFTFFPPTTTNSKISLVSNSKIYLKIIFIWNDIKNFIIWFFNRKKFKKQIHFFRDGIFRWTVSKIGKYWPGPSNGLPAH